MASARLAPKWYRRTEGSQKRTLGFIANEIQETGPVGQALCGKLMDEALRKLHQLARREFPDRPGMTSARAAQALRDDVARQILASKPRFLGKSAAEGPNDRLQADLDRLQRQHSGGQQVRADCLGCFHPRGSDQSPAR